MGGNYTGSGAPQLLVWAVLHDALPRRRFGQNVAQRIEVKTADRYATVQLRQQLLPADRNQGAQRSFTSYHRAACGCECSTGHDAVDPE